MNSPAASRAVRRNVSDLQLPLLLCLACAAVPAWAADATCPDLGSTDRGIEDSEGATGENSTCASNASAYGFGNYASQIQSSAFGYGNIAGSPRSSVFGFLNSASNAYANAFGGENEANGFEANAFGAQNGAYGDYASAFGFDNTTSALGANAFGYSNVAQSAGSSAFGYDNEASAIESSAFGYQSRALNQGSTAIGYQAIADRDYAVSVGQVGAEHQIIHVADGTADTDAVNLRQLNAAILGAGSYTGWSLTADGGATSEAIDDGETVSFEAHDANGNLVVSRSGNSISYGFSANPTFGGLTVGGGGAGFTIVNNTIIDMGGNVVGGVADGVAATDAVNKGQLDAALLGAGAGAQAALDAANAAQATADTALAAVGTAVGAANGYTDAREEAVRGDMAAGDAETLADAQAYADTRSSAAVETARTYTDRRMDAWNDTFDQYRQEVDVRFAATDARIDRMGAMSGAMAAAAMNTAGLPGQNRVGVGASAQNGRAAVALGYQRVLSPNTSISLGGAFTGGESNISVGAGFSW